jgi:hypothetical protein
MIMKTFQWHEYLLLARQLQLAAPSQQWAVVLDVSPASGNSPEIVYVASHGSCRQKTATPPAQHAVWAPLRALLDAPPAPTARMA